MKVSFLPVAILVFCCTSWLTAQQFFDIKAYGAIGDGSHLNTDAIQSAIDAAAGAGGGTILIPPGTWLSGTIFLKSNTTLHLSAGATLLGSPNIADYTEMTWGHNKDRQPYHLIVTQAQENVTVEGKGTIDGNGEAFWKAYEKDDQGKMVVPRWIMAKEKKVSPLIELTGSQNLYVRDITIKTGGGWNLHIHDCDLVKVQGVNIINNLYSPNSDGIDITGSSDVMISDCYIKTCDDAICLKTTPDSRSCHRVTITNCVLETLCVGLKLGCNESFKDITDVTMSNCVVNNSSRAVGLYVREGAIYERINITNIVANTNAPLIFNRPIQFMVEKRNPDTKAGGIRDVTISNFTATTEGRILLTAADGGFLENITMRDITLRYPMIEDPRPMVKGSGSSQFPKIDRHPEAMGALAAVVADNVQNLQLENLQVFWPENTTTPEHWAHPERIENGSLRIHKMDYSKARQAEFAVIWGKNLKGGRLNAPLTNASSSSEKKYVLQNSDIQIIE